MSRCPVVEFTGRVWRIHKQRYDATDATGSLRVSGRFHRGSDRYPVEATWPALYTALGAEIALGELMRHLTPELLPHLNGFRLTELVVVLGSVLDCTDPSTMGMELEDLVADHSLDRTRSIAAIARSSGHEALLAPSATHLGNNLIILTENLIPSSRIAIVSSRDPRLRADL